MGDITIKYDGKTKRVDRDEFIHRSNDMLHDFGLESTIDEIGTQVDNILQGRELNVIGVMLQDYVVKP